MTLRVLQVVDTLAQGGRERLVVDLANAHAKAGRASFVCETRQSGALVGELDSAVGHFVLGRSRRWDVGAVRAFAKLVRDNRIDVIHSHGRAVMQFVALVKSARRLPAAHLFHDHLPGVDATTPASLGLRVAFRFGADGVISVSDDLRQWAVQRLGAPAPRVWCVLNGVDVALVATAVPADITRLLPPAPHGRPVVVAVGNVRPQKDYETLLRAVAMVDADPVLVVLGSLEHDPAYTRRCAALAKSLGIDNSVVFAGLRTDIPELLASADVGVLTSRAESGPLAVAEYAAAGLPIVATATGSITAAIAGEAFATVVPVGDYEAVARGLAAMLALSPAQRVEYRAAAQAAARRLFSLDRMAEELGQVYTAVLGRAPVESRRVRTR